MSQIIKTIISLPISGAGCQTANFITRDLALVLRVEGAVWEYGPTWQCEFRTFSAFRFRTEHLSRGFVPESYDTLCEVLHSDWLGEMERINPKGMVILGKRHFAVMLSNVGYFEILAAEVDVPPMAI